MSSANVKFNSNENKGLLWNLLVEHGSFNGIHNSRMADVKRAFEENINNLSNKNGNLMEVNKEFVQRMLKVLPMFKGMGPPRSGKTGGGIEEVYTAEKIQNNRIDQFNSKLSDVKNNFDSMIKLKKPSEIDFSDKKQNDFNSNIDQDLAAAIASRQLDMEQMVSSQQSSKQEAEAWINSSNSNSNTNISLEVSDKKPKKKVTFENDIQADSEKNDDALTDLFDNLKQQSSTLDSKGNNEKLISLVERIIVNQETIIELLKASREK